MATEWWHEALSVIFFLGVCGPILGLIGICRRASVDTRRRFILRVAAVAVLGGLGGAGFALGLAPGVWAPPLVLAGTCFAFAAARFPLLRRVGSGVLVFARDRRVPAFVLLLLCPAGALVWVNHLDQLNPDHSYGVDDFDGSEHRPPLTAVEPSPATTDCGRPVRLGYPTDPSQETQAYERSEGKVVRAQKLALQVIRTAPADPGYNCLGWVFTGGRYWVSKSADVELILHDNGYRPQSVPRAGDLAIYRNEQGDIVHAGIVRANDPFGLALVESKWGCLGRFIHPADVHCYPNTVCTYYQTSRSHGHLLQGLVQPGTTPEPTRKPMSPTILSGD